MKVRAIRLGYYNHKRRREGDIFEIANEKQFSQIWMVKIGSKTPKVAQPEEEEAPVTQASSEEVI